MDIRFIIEGLNEYRGEERININSQVSGFSDWMAFTEMRETGERTALSYIMFGLDY